jgi:hypothetical protein
MARASDKRTATDSTAKQVSMEVVKAKSPPRKPLGAAPKKNQVCKLIVVGTHAELPLVLVLYENNTQKQDAYNNGIREAIFNPHTRPTIMKGTHWVLHPRRAPGTDNTMEQLNKSTGVSYPRHVFVRLLDKAPTEQDRHETLNMLELAIKEDKSSKYKPDVIQRHDLNKQGILRPLDECEYDRHSMLLQQCYLLIAKSDTWSVLSDLHDGNIKDIITTLFDDTSLSEQFYEDYTDMAKWIYSRPTTHEFPSALGYVFDT